MSVILATRHLTVLICGCFGWANAQFALFGNYGQRICVDPVSKLIMVQTSVEAKTGIWRLWSALVKQFGCP
jgi:hypothetical protein